MRCASKLLSCCLWCPNCTETATVTTSIDVSVTDASVTAAAHSAVSIETAAVAASASVESATVPALSSVESAATTTSSPIVSEAAAIDSATVAVAADASASDAALETAEASKLTAAAAVAPKQMYVH